MILVHIWLRSIETIFTKFASIENLLLDLDAAFSGYVLHWPSLPIITPPLLNVTPSEGILL